MDCSSSLPTIGQALPEFTAVTTQGSITLPADASGKWLVLFSHPADFTPVCTTEICSFQKRIEGFRELNCMLVGLSIDQVWSHIKWLEWIREKLNYSIEYPIIADDRGEVAAKLGMVHPGKGTNTVRAVFIVDPKGIVRLIVYYPQEVGRNMDEILRALKALQTADAQGCAIPANWPKNGLIGSHVLVPPPADVQSARTRLDKYEGYDWWFCHRPLD